MTVLLWCAVFVLAVSFLGGFAFVDPVILAMRWQDRIDYAAYDDRGLPQPTVQSLLPIAAFWQTAVAAAIFFALWTCLRRVEMDWAGGLLVGAFGVGTLWTAGFVALTPKTPRLPVIVSSIRVIVMAATTWVVYASI